MATSTIRVLKRTHLSDEEKKKITLTRTILFTDSCVALGFGRTQRGWYCAPVRSSYSIEHERCASFESDIRSPPHNIIVIYSDLSRQACRIDSECELYTGAHLRTLSAGRTERRSLVSSFRLGPERGVGGALIQSVAYSVFAKTYRRATTFALVIIVLLDKPRNGTSSA